MRATQRLGWMTVQGQEGYTTGAEHVMTTYGIGFDAQLADSLRIALSHTSEPFVVSPRTVGLGMTTTSQRGQLEWLAMQRNQLVVDGAFQELSDGNRRWEMSISPRRTVARRARFNLDLGGVAYQLGNVATSITATTIPAATSFMRRRCTHTSRCEKTSAWQ